MHIFVIFDLDLTLKGTELGRYLYLYLSTCTYKYIFQYLYLDSSTFLKCSKYLYLDSSTFEKYLNFQVLFQILFKYFSSLFIRILQQIIIIFCNEIHILTIHLTKYKIDIKGIICIMIFLLHVYHHYNKP